MLLCGLQKLSFFLRFIKPFQTLLDYLRNALSLSLDQYCFSLLLSVLFWRCFHVLYWFCIITLNFKKVKEILFVFLNFGDLHLTHRQVQSASVILCYSARQENNISDFKNKS